jgi:hypothetical protein
MAKIIDATLQILVANAPKITDLAMGRNFPVMSEIDQESVCQESVATEIHYYRPCS